MAKLQEFNLSWFDLVVVAFIVVGLIRGRKRGMSEELLDVFKWLLIVVLSAQMYQPIGSFLSAFSHLNLLTCYATAYLFTAISISIAFKLFKRAIGEKLVGSDLFGSMEYYLGMAAGMVRFVCMLLAGLALLHAPAISEEAMRTNAKMQQDNFGSISFPTLGSIRQEVFHNSICGQLVTAHLNSQLIVPTPFAKPSALRDGIARRRESAVDDAISARPNR